jgi:hypothetical protein
MNVSSSSVLHVATDGTDQSRSSGNYSCVPRQDRSKFSYNSSFPSRVHKSLTLDILLSQFNTVHIGIFSFFKIHNYKFREKINKIDTTVSTFVYLLLAALKHIN